MKKILFFCAVAAVGFQSCSEDNSSSGNVTIDGQAEAFNLNTGQDWSFSGGVDTNKCIYGCTLTESISVQYPQLNVSYGVNRFLMGEDENFDTYITAGSKGFLTGGYGTDGVGISYQANSSSDVYTTTAGSQTGSTATVSAVTHTPGVVPYTTFTITFSCKLYNENNPSDMKTASGEVNARMYPYF